MKFIKELIPIHARKLVLVLLLALLNPINITFTESSQAAYQTGSAFFNASGQYLSVPNNSDFAVGTGDFTVEWWQNMSYAPDATKFYGWPRAWQIDAASPFGVSIEPGGPTSQDNPKVYLYLNGATQFGTLTGFASNYQYKWTHFAVIRTGSTVRMFVDGTQQGSDQTNNYNFTDTSTALTIGNRVSESNTDVFPGYISNFHFVKGTALYTSNFTRPNAPTTAVANTKLLLLHKSSSNFLTDSSNLAKVVTNVGSVQYNSFAPSWATDSVVPTLSSTSMASNGLSIGLTFSELLSSTTASPSDFSVNIGGIETATISSVTASGNTVTLNFSSVLPAGRTINVNYTDPTASDDSNAIQDDYGNDAATFTNQTVRNIAQSLTDYAYSSDGSGNKHLYSASVTGSTGNQIPDTLTAESWIYPTGLDCKGGSSSTWSNNDVYCHIVSKGNQLSLFLASSYNPSASAGTLGFIYGGQVKYSRLKIPLNEWHHVAFSREGAGAGSSKLYLDGNLVLEETTTASSANTTRDFTIGSSRSEGTNSDYVYGKFIGQIDEVKLSKSYRDQATVQYDMRHHNTNDSNFLLYYDFNQDSGNSLVNRASGATSATDLTVLGSPTFDSTKIFVTDTTTQTAYTIIKFYRDFIVDANGWTSPSNVNSIRFMAVGGGGGGGGGWNGGGGGAGGYREASTTISPNTVYNVEIGTGGNGALYKYGPTAGSGSIFRNNSTSTTLFQVSGGGRGATEQNMSGGPIQAANSGGSGGGGAHGGGITAGSGNSGSYSPVEGYAGGQGYSATGFYVGGGGGGAGGGGSAAGPSAPGAGGVGVTTYITGAQLKVAGGGAGAGRLDISGLRAFSGTGDGSDYGGGTGFVTTSSANASMDTGTAGTKNTGGGGGGGATTTTGEAEGGAGGSGFIVIKYLNKPVITRQPVSDTITVGMVETFTINTSAPVSPVSKSVKWQYSSDTTTVIEANISGWTDVSTGTGYTTDTFTTSAATKAMNKYRYRAIVTFSDTSTITSIETSTIATLTINDSIILTSDTSTITRKYGDTQTVRTISFTGGTAPVSVATPYGALANGKIYIDTSTSTKYFKVDTGTVVGTYYETVTVTDYFGISASYVQKVIVNPADTLTVQADTLTAITYNPSGMTIEPTVTITGLVNSDTKTSITIKYSSPGSTCANGGVCTEGETGPGGGIIFKVIGSTYYEAAPKTWYSTVTYNGGSYSNSTVVYCANASNTKIDPYNPPSNTSNTGWGGGKVNTDAFRAYCEKGAVGLVGTYTGGSKTDWYIPNATEMNGLQSYWYNRSALSTQFASTISKYFWTSDASYNATWGWLLTQPYFDANGAWQTAGAAYNHQGGLIIPIRTFTVDGAAQPVLDSTTVKPLNAGTFTITPSLLVLANGVDTSNYVSVVYRTSLFTINKATQSTLKITSSMSPFNGNPSNMKLLTSGGTDTGTVSYAVTTGGTAGGCSTSADVLTVTSAGTCKVVATKAATVNYLVTISDTATITFSQFLSHQQTQTQLYPNMIPINGANSLETTTVTVPVITSITSSGGGAYVISGSGFTGTTRVSIGGTAITFTLVNGTTINISGAGSAMGPVIIECSDGRFGPVPFWIFTP